MKKHTKIWMQALGYEEGDFIPCEVTGDPAVDISHINPRGMGGDPTGVKDCIENLMAVSRGYHTRCEQKQISKREQVDAHFKFLRDHGVQFSESWHEEHGTFKSEL